MENKKEPLLSWKEWLNINANTETDGNWIDAYVKYYTKWHLNNVKEVIINETDIYLGVTVKEVEQSITNAVEKYIEINLNK